jgi:hypothetical protein
MASLIDIRHVSLAGESWRDTGHLPSSDPDTDEYEGRMGEWGSTIRPAGSANRGHQLAVQSRRARAMVYDRQWVAWENEYNRHHAAAERLYDLIDQPQPTLVQYDAAMAILLTHGRQCVRHYDLPEWGECRTAHQCHACESRFYCGFIGTLIGCPFHGDSWAHSWNRSFPQVCNNCMPWTDYLRNYQHPTRILRHRGHTGQRFVYQNIPQVEIDAILEAIKQRKALTDDATEVVLLNLKHRRAAEDRAYYRRRKRSLQLRGLHVARLSARCYVERRNTRGSRILRLAFQVLAEGHGRGGELVVED